MDESDKRELFLIRLKNIKDKSEEQWNNQLKLVKNNNINSVQKESLDRLKFWSNMSQNAKENF